MTTTPLSRSSAELRSNCRLQTRLPFPSHRSMKKSLDPPTPPEPPPTAIRSPPYEVTPRKYPGAAEVRDHTCGFVGRNLRMYGMPGPLSAVVPTAYRFPPSV